MNNLLNPAQLVIVEPGNLIRTFMLTQEQLTIGRVGGANDIFINSSIVSSQHGMITQYNGMYVYNDLSSTNGTSINGKKINCVPGQASSSIPLRDGDILSIGAENNAREKVFMLFSTTTNENYEWNVISLSSNPVISIGRGEDNNIVVPSITVSRRHAQITTSGTSVEISDLNSANGTIVSGSMIRGRVPLKNAAVVMLDRTKIVRLDHYLVYSVPVASRPVNVVQYQKSIMQQAGNKPKQMPKEMPQSYGYARQGGVQVTVENVSRIVPCKNGTGINGTNKKSILDHVSLTINPGELVAILGGSGAGKTTFMNCINGFEPATEGRVLINGTDLYKNYQSIKSSIGYVPQQDIVHDNLTLEAMLTYTGKLRLPRDVSKQELSQRVTEVMDMVDLGPQKDTFIKKLSGGQRKRASIAVELISDPSLFFLDEPTSGLDPEAETNLMHQLRGLSEKKGKTVIVITHTLQNIDIFDKIIFLAPGGKLCFYGTPKQAQEFFQVDNLTDAYEKISKDINGYVKKYNSAKQKGEI